MTRKRQETLVGVDVPAASMSASLANILCESLLCSSLEEAEAIVDDIFAKEEDDDIIVADANRSVASCVSALQEYFSLTEEQATELVQKAMMGLVDEHDTDGDQSEEQNELEDDTSNDEEGDDDGEEIGEGECELCERFIQLTKHHLIPRCTWPRIKTRCLHAVDALSRQDEHRANVILGPGLEHLVPLLLLDDNHKSSIKRALQRTCNICRPCHSALHGAHDNLTLALDYNTVEKLLEDETVHKFCKWASKQKPGKYAVQQKR